MLSCNFTSQYLRDYAKMIKRGMSDERLQSVISMLCSEQPLAASYRDHALKPSRKYKHSREVHIYPDLLLVYKIDYERNALYLVRLGSHSDLF